jgi:predicted O-linked N-acetylglucosamine transferase (SPINDLY family)
MAKLGENDYQVVIYPDVGMCMESILLANRRIAPIQLCWPGHSVSTWGADMDYYVSGKDVELPVNPEVNYSERLVLIPGMGVIHNKPTYKAIGAKPKDDDRIVINCSWNTQKVNYPFILTLKKLLERANRKILFRLFIGYSTARGNDHIPFVRDLNAHLGAENVEVLAQLDYERYMNLMEEGHFSMDSFHFGGCNTISDSLWLRLPTISWEGSKWYSRIGPEMLRLVGMQECVARTEEEYLNLALKMIQDPDYRADIHNRLLPVDLDATIYSTEPAKYFLNTIDYLIENHATLKAEGKHDPIYIT